jgi:TFIIF-interacting CTD phosphatase-like protein
VFIKDLRKIGNRDLKNMILVDNNPVCLIFNLDNGFPILEWKGEETDQELVYLKKFLDQIADCEDVRPVLRDKLKLRELLNLDEKKVMDNLLHPLF